MAELQPFAKNIFLMDGPPVRALGVEFPTRMVVVKLGDGSLWVNSPVSASGKTLDQIRTLGPIRHLVAPTKMHIWRLEEWRTIFQDAALWVPPEIPRQFKRLPFAGILGDEPPAVWADDFDQLVFRGNLFIEEVYFLHRETKTVVFGDFIQNHPLTKHRLFFNALVKIGGVAYPHGGVPIDIRLSFTNRTATRHSLDRLLAWDFDKLILAHGVCVERDAKRFVEHAFQWLRK